MTFYGRTALFLATSPFSLLRVLAGAAWFLLKCAFVALACMSLAFLQLPLLLPHLLARFLRLWVEHQESRYGDVPAHILAAMPLLGRVEKMSYAPAGLIPVAEKALWGDSWQ